MTSLKRTSMVVRQVLFAAAFGLTTLPTNASESDERLQAHSRPALAIQHVQAEPASRFQDGLSAFVRDDYSTALEILRPIAERGNAEAQRVIGDVYRFGFGLAPDNAEAARWYRRAAAQGHAEAQFQLGDIYRMGLGVPVDSAEAAKWYRRAAVQGHFLAQAIGEQLQAPLRSLEDGLAAYDRGEYAMALQILYPLADQGSAEAQNTIGTLFSDGLGVTEDNVEAVQWFRLAAEQGYAKAQDNLGHMYLNGFGVTEDDVEAVNWFRLAAEQGDASAQYGLGFMYESGRGVRKDFAEALSWYLRSAEQAFVVAQLRVGVMYELGKGVQHDGAEAMRWYGLAAEQGNAIAVESLARGGDYSTALKMLLSLAKRGNVDAQAVVGGMYESGPGNTRDYSEAAKWYRRAAEQGDAGAQFQLGEMYESGRGVPKSFAEAQRWYRLAAEQGHDLARRQMEHARDEPAPSFESGLAAYEAGDYAVALESFRLFADEGNADAQFRLGVMHERGEGVPQDDIEAQKWYGQAAEQAHRLAQANLDLLNPIDDSIPAERRIALIVGIEDYPDEIGHLDNPHEDAANIAATLKSIGFTLVTGDVVLDADRRRLSEVIRDFRRAVADAGPDAVGFFYYSGHGGSNEVPGQRRRNYLIPSRSPVANAADLPVEGIDLGGVIDSLAATQAKAVFVVSDACRNTLPWTTNKGGSQTDKGFVTEPQRTGLFIAHATADGETAPDDGKFAVALARHLATPGVYAPRAFTLAFREVANSRATYRRPVASDQLNSDVCFVSCP